jgi:hypothetical protein
MNSVLLTSITRLAGFAGMAVIIHFMQVHQAFAQAPKARALAVNERIRIDAKLDEPVWKSAAPIGDLVQVLPKEGGSPSEKTEVRVLVDNEALYFGITCFDRTPVDIISTQLTRDALLEADDNISIVINPFFDHRNGFFFPSILRGRALMDKSLTAQSLQVWIGTEYGMLILALLRQAGLRRLPFLLKLFNPMSIAWQISLDGGVNWYNTGISSNQTYFTLIDPATTNLYHTVVDIAC